MIAKKIPGKGKYYDFSNPNEIASTIYSQLNDLMAEEAKKVFNYATNLFIEMFSRLWSIDNRSLIKKFFFNSELNSNWTIDE